MKRERIKKQQDTLREEIKSVAKQLMVKHGTAGVSIREIAREMDLSAPALYYYFANLEALITALLGDAFNTLADALEAERDAHADQLPGQRLMAFAEFYRRWALDHPIDFQLMYGNPIPGYQAPADVTVPAVIRSFSVMVSLMAHVIAHHDYHPAPAYGSVPPELEAHLNGLVAQDGYLVPPLALYLGLVAWPQMHGIVMLEMFNHIQAGVGDVDAFYRIQMQNLFRSFGLSL